MSCKQEDQEATVLLKSYNLITVTETWWEGLQNSCAATNDQKLFLRDRQGRKEQAVALCVKKKKKTDSTELPLKKSNKKKLGNLMDGVYYRPPNRGELVD